MHLSFERTAYDAGTEAIPRLIYELRAVLRHPHATAEDRIQQAKALLNALPGNYGESGAQVAAATRRSPERGGLAPWQVRCVKEYIEEALANRLTGADLATRVRLSEHHFYRAFRVSLKQTPRTYLVQRRIARACHMMRSSNWRIGQIAMECGFADQAHFNRCFRKLFGTSPGAWRRAQIGAVLTPSQHPHSKHAVSIV
jgi:AraC-like DNA-binding protein